MSPGEIAAYVGAAAWLPQITAWVYRAYVKPVVTIVVDQYAEVSFTSLGPIFNMKMAFSSDKKDVIIDGFELHLTHSEGEVRKLRWAGLNETSAIFTDSTGYRQVMTREQTPIALNIGTESLIEKFVRFQDPRYHEENGSATSQLIAHFNYLKRTEPEGFVDKILRSKELDSVFEIREKLFCWQPGNYRVSIHMSSPKKFKLNQRDLYFFLSKDDINRLRENIETVKNDLINVISTSLPDYQAQPINWNWANVNVRTVANLKSNAWTRFVVSKNING